MSLGEVEDLLFREVEVQAGFTKTQEAALPDLQGRFLLNFGVVETDVDARSECFVECADSVGGKDYDAGKVF